MSGGKEFGLGGMLYILAIIGIVVATIFEGYFGGFEITDSTLEPTDRVAIIHRCKNEILDLAKAHGYEITSKQVNIHGDSSDFLKYKLKKEDSIFFIHVANHNEENGELYVTLNHYTTSNDETFDLAFFTGLIQKTCQADFKKETCIDFIEADESTYPDLERGFDVLEDKNVYKMMYINDAQYNAISHLVDYETEPNEHYLMFEGWSDEIIKD